MSREEPGYISLLELHRLDWSTRLAWQLLGRPDRSLTEEPFPKLPAKQLYLGERIRAASRPDDRRFQGLRLASLLRDVFRFQAGLEEAVRWAESAPLGAEIPRMGWEELKAVGMEYRRRLHGDWVPPREAGDPDRLATLAAYVYLKHECTGYDGLCEFIRGRPYARFTYPVILHRTNRAILEIHPECLPRVKGRRDSAVFRCGRCGRTAPGNQNGHYFEKPDRWVQRLTNYERGGIQDFCSRRCSMPGAARREAAGWERGEEKWPTTR